MVKKLVFITLIVGIWFTFGSAAFAAYVTGGNYYDYNDTYEFTIDMDVNGSYPADYYKVYLDDSFLYSSLGLNPLSAQRYTVKCNGTYTFKFYDEDHELVGSSDGQSFNIDMIQNPSCPGENSSDNDNSSTDDPDPSDNGEDTPSEEEESNICDGQDIYNPNCSEYVCDDENSYLYEGCPDYEEPDPCDGYLSYMYPQCPDYQPPDDDNTEDNPSDDSGNDGGNSTGVDTGGTSCPVCDLFSCPNWSDYMGKVNEIIAGFPTIEEAIEEQTDRIENDIVGQPPSLPSEPSQSDTVDTYDFENSSPQMKENEELADSGFALSDLESEAPEIEFRDDPTGGFDIANPIDALPDIPTEFPIPGETESDWDENKPEGSEVFTPEPPTLKQPTISNPPEPSEGNIEPPMPGEGESTVPLPSTETKIEGSYKYKTHPDNPDGV